MVWAGETVSVKSVKGRYVSPVMVPLTVMVPQVAQNCVVLRGQNGGREVRKVVLCALWVNTRKRWKYFPDNFLVLVN